MRTALYGLLASLIGLAPLAGVADGLPGSPYIQVNGHAELEVAPDMAYVSLTLEKTDLDAKAARADVEGRTAKVIALARKLGIADKDIDAPSVSVVSQYGWVPDNSAALKRVYKLTGHHVTRGVTLTLRDLSRYGELVDGLFDAGVTDLGNVVMDRSDRAELQQKARGLAVADAHDKAAGLAQSAGVTLGPVYSINDQSAAYGPRPMMMARAEGASADSAAPEYLSGKMQIGADATVYYLIK
jgi:uncharacterized protein